MNSRGMGWGRGVLVTLAICTLASSRLAAVPKKAAAALPGPIPNLQAYWPLDTDATDQTNNSNDGTPQNSPVFDSTHAAVPAGNTGSADFNGVDSRFNVPDSPSLSVTGSLTITAWVKTDVASFPAGTLQEIVGKNGGGIPGGYFMRVNTGGGIFFQVTTSGGVTSGLSGTNKQLTPNGTTWNHVAATYDSSTGAMHYYIDGAQSSDTITASGPPGDGDAGLIIGYNGSNPFDGHIDEVRIYSRALNIDEIATLKNGVQDPPTGLGATPGAGQIALSWTAPAALPTPISYNIYRAITGGAFSYYASSATTNYTDTGVSNPTSYDYKVTAVAALESAQAGPTAAVPLAAVPAGPKTNKSGGNNNIGHRCGCNSVSPTEGTLLLWAAAGMAALALLLRRR